MAAIFRWNNRKHSAACAANVPLLDELVLLFESAKESGEAAAAAKGEQPHKSKMCRAYGKAIDSLAKYPMPVTSAEEAEELSGIGSFLAARIGKILQKLEINPAVAPMQPPAAAMSTAATASSPVAVAVAAAVAAPKPRKRKQATSVADADGAASALAASTSGVAAAASSPVPPASKSIPILPPMPRSLSPETLAAIAPTAAAAAPVLPPACPFGGLCYRTNPAHFVEQSHPPDHPMAIHAVRAAASSGWLLMPARSQSAQPPPLSHPHRNVHMRDDDFLDSDDDVIDLTSPPAAVTAVARAASVPVVTPAAALAAPAAIRPPAAATSAAVTLACPPPASIFTAEGIAAASAASVAAPPAAKRARVDKAYKPKLHSSAYALLMSLADACARSASGAASLTKAQVLAGALEHFRPAKEQNNNAASSEPAPPAPAPPASGPDLTTSLWSGMSNLITRDLVDKALTPVSYSLTELGRACAAQFAPPPVRTLTRPSPSPSPDFSLSPMPSTDDIRRSPPPAPPAAVAAPSAAAAAAAPVRLASAVLPAAPLPPLHRTFCPGADFDVVLLIDMRERSGRKDAAYMSEKLGKLGLTTEVRALAVGDFMFLARHRGQREVELVLDCMIERKRVSDLVSSIRDGRYQEQRARLRRTGLKRVMYVIEGPVTQETVHGLPLSTVESVLTSMNGVHGLFVQHTPSIDATISLLASMHHMMRDEMTRQGAPIITHEGGSIPTLLTGGQLPNLAELPGVSASLHGCGESFASFSSRLHKSAHLLSAELFGTQLRQIRGVSAALALSVIEQYPCARALCDAYERRSMGKAMSLKIRTFFRSKELQ